MVARRLSRNDLGVEVATPSPSSSAGRTRVPNHDGDGETPSGSCFARASLVAAGEDRGAALAPTVGRAVWDVRGCDAMTEQPATTVVTANKDSESLEII